MNVSHKFRASVGAMLGALTLLIGLPDLAIAATGNQTFLVVNTSATEGRVVAVGLLSSTGSVVLPQGQGPGPFPAQFIFEEGTLFLTIIPTGNDLAFNPSSCVFSGGIAGRYDVTGGTGQLAGASGSGGFVGHVVLVFDRDPGGQCLGPETGQPPRRGTQIVRNSGIITLPSLAH